MVRTTLTHFGRNGSLATLAQQGDEGLMVDTAMAGDAHGSPAAAVKVIEQVLALGWRIAITTITAGEDDGGLGGVVGWQNLLTGIWMLVLPGNGKWPTIDLSQIDGFLPEMKGRVAGE